MTAPTSPAGLDLPALQRYFDAHVPEAAGPLTARLLAGGKSNLTYRLSDGVHDWVLRRPPLGPLTPTAHDMAREYRIVAALGDTDVPVAEAVALCEDTDVIGVPFAVVSFVDGVVLQDGQDAAALTEAQARGAATALVDALASLHAVDYTAVGLGEFGRPAGYLERQIRRWRGQWDRVATRDLPALDRLADALARACPPQAGETIVHGDYRLDNTILAHDYAGLAAIVDWEMATLGDPLADLGLLQVYWDDATESVLGVRHAPSANPGFGTADELAARYAERTGRRLDNLGFYRALGYFKLAVIAEGIHQRYLAGKTVGDGFATIGAAVPGLLDAGLAALA
jgi:aminoglycoside phosphotransferase (APT) family kinase protein